MRVRQNNGNGNTTTTTANADEVSVRNSQHHGNGTTTSSEVGVGTDGTVTVGSSSERNGTTTGADASLNVSDDGVTGTAGANIDWGRVGVGFETSFEFSETEDVTEENGYTTVTVTGRSSVSANANLDVGAVGLEGGVSRGSEVQYQVRMRTEDYERIQEENLPPPDPFNPETMPPGSSVILNSEDFEGTEFEAAYHALAVKTGHTESEGTSIAVEALDNGNIRATAGPTQGVEQNLWIGAEFAGFSAGIGNDTTLDTYQLRAAEFDVMTTEGRAAYNDFLANGTIPEVDGAGVTHTARIEKLTYDSQTTASIGAGPLELSLEGNSSSANQIVTTYADGSQRIQTEASWNDRSVAIDVRMDEDGEVIDGPDLQFTLNEVEENYAGTLAHIYGEENVAFSGDQTVTISLTAEEAMDLQEAAYDSVERTNAESGIEGEYFEEQLEDPGGLLLGDRNLLELARAENPNEVARALLSGLDSAESFIDSLVRVSLDNDSGLPGDLHISDAE